jgi:hypothetical protein
MLPAMLATLLLACASPSTSDPPVATDDLHGRVDAVGDREVLYLWGTREEMGYAEGTLMCDRVASLFKDYLLEDLVVTHSSYTYDVARAFVLASVKFDDRDLAELTAMYQGMLDHCTAEQLTVTSDYLEPSANGSRELEFEDLLFANAVADFGCSSFSVWGDASATGDTINGRNFDWAIDPQGTFVRNHMVKVYDSTEENARFLSIMVPAMAGCVSCVTEEGVALTMHNVGGLPNTYNVDISPRMFAARAALASTYGADDLVDAAEETLEARRQLTGNNLHLAYPLARGDGTGGAVVFEYDGDYDAPDGEVTVRRPGEDPDFDRDDGIVAANHYIKRAPRPADDDDSEIRTTELRAAIDAGAAQGGIDLEAGRTMLATVKNGYSGITTHSILLDTANRELQLFVAPDADDAAPDFDPVSIDLDALFDKLP